MCVANPIITGSDFHLNFSVCYEVEFFLCTFGHFGFYFLKLTICVFFSDFLMSHIVFLLDL